MERTASEPNKPDANENAAVVDDVPTVRDLLDYQDEATTEEEANQYWSHINAEADRWRKQVVDYIGPWGMPRFYSFSPLLVCVELIHAPSAFAFTN
jgi:hypothetical protein